MKTAIGAFCVFSALIASALADDRLIWSLGAPDASSAEFKIPYNAWEYGNAPQIQKSDKMDFKAHVFNYQMRVNKAVASPEIPVGLITEYARFFMKDDEIVSGLKISWDEAEAGMRKLELDLVDWRDMAGAGSGLGLDGKGIELSLPEGGKRIFHLPPAKAAKKGEVLKLSAVFPVKAGANSLTLRIASMVKHYRFNFDYIALSKSAEASDAKPLLESSFDADGAVYHPGEDAVFSIKAFNIPDGKGEVSYSVKDAFGKELASGKAELKGSQASIKVPTGVKGWFEVEAKCGDATTRNSYASIEAVSPEYVDDSRFGSHAIGGDGYRDRYWPEYQASMMRKAFLAGTKWVRQHGFHWFLREPEQGKFDWNSFDQRVALAEKYKLRCLITVTGTPKWASSSDNTKLTVCGTYYYQNYPPKKPEYLSDFMTALVSRYKDRIKWYELGNEPGYASAFWCNGSAPDFGAFLKDGYEGAKKADPDCVIVSGAPLEASFFEDVVKSCGGKLYFDVMSVHYLQNGKRGGERFEKWRSSLDKMGGSEIPIINSEEMHWKNDGSALSLSSALVEVHVREAALGIEKTFAFDFFRNGSIYDVSAFDWSGKPLPQYAAYRTMTHRLERAKFAADLSTPETEAYLFDRQGTAVMVVWSEKARSFDIPFVLASAKIVDVMDCEKTVKSVNGVLRVETSKVPLFIEGGDLKSLGKYGELLKAFPKKLNAKPGSTLERTLKLPAAISAPDIKLPSNWTGSIADAKLRVSVPSSAVEGVYDAKAVAKIDGREVEIPFLVDVSSGVLGENLIKNGDFSEGTRFWFYPKEKEKFDVLSGIGSEGGNAVRTKGPVFFGCAGGVKVRQGERYALIAKAKGSGFFGGVYTLKDAAGKTVFPKTQGINCLTGRLGPDWQTYSDVITINEPGAEILKFAMLSNHADKDGKEAFFDKLAIVRLTDKFTPAKALYSGVCAKSQGAPDWAKIPPMKVSGGEHVVKQGSSVKWEGDADLSAECRLAMDGKFIYLNFLVKDSKSVPPPAGSDLADAWRFDSIQFAIDPTLEGKDRTEILIARDVSGKAQVYKHSNFWTPELPENITRRGLLKDAKVDAKPLEGGMEYIVEIPLNELYPLSGKATEFGFSWLVNDGDGAGRKYVEWASGIGPSKDSSLFGLVKVAK